MTPVRVQILFLMLALTATPSAQPAANDLVVVITGTKQFHQPTCPLVANAGTHVTVMKRSEAIRKGLTAHDCGKVYTQPGDNKYHLATCPKLGANRTAITLEEAGKKFWPCPVCHPPIRQRTPQS
jgi:hypothetical protein